MLLKPWKKPRKTDIDGKMTTAQERLRITRTRSSSPPERYDIHGEVKYMKTPKDVGLGYVRLGQPSTQLSGGEAQRIKLAFELSKRSTGKTLYILDEPTTGLHVDDVSRLVEILQRLVEAGNTVVVIEHNLDMIKCADYIIDLGPEGGDKGGTLVAQGTPEEIVKNDKSHTGKYLKKLLS